MVMTHPQFETWLVEQVESSSVQDVSNRTGVARQTIYNLMNGQFPTQKTAEALGFSVMFVPKKV